MVKSMVSTVEMKRATTEDIPCVTSTFAMIGIISSYGATVNPVLKVLAKSVTRDALEVLRERFVMVNTISVTNTEGIAAHTRQWTRAKSGAFAADDVSIAALDRGDIPLLKQVLETTVLVTYFLEKFRVPFTFTSVTLTAVTAAYESFATIDIRV